MSPREYPTEVPYPLVPAKGHRWLWPLDAQQYDEMQDRGREADMERIKRITLSDLQKDVEFMRQKGLAGIPLYNYAASKLLKRAATASVVYGGNGPEA